MKKLFLLLSLISLVSLRNLAQTTDTINYDSQWNKTNIKDSIYFYIIKSSDKNGKPVGKQREYYKTGQVKSEVEMLSFDPQIKQGLETDYYENGKKKQEYYYNNGEFMGIHHQWDEEGNLIVTRFYIDGINIVQTIIDKKLYDFKPDNLQSSLSYLEKALNLPLKQDLETAQLFDDWGLNHGGANEYSKALNFFMIAVNLKQKLNQQLSLAETYTNIAWAHYYEGDGEKAKQFNEWATAILEKEKGTSNSKYLEIAENIKYLKQELQAKNGVNILKNLYDQIKINYQEGKVEKAIEFALQAQDAAEKGFGKEHANYATSLYTLAFLYDNIGSFEKAEPLLAEALSIRKKIYDESHPDIINTLEALAALYCKMGNYIKAEPLYLEALSINKNTFGDTHPEYANSLNTLIDLYKSMGNYTKAVFLSNEAADIRKKTLGENHPDYATALNDLATLYYKMGDFTKAEPLYIQSKDILKKSLGDNHPNYASSLNNLALLYNNMGEYTKAEHLYLESLTIRKKVLGENHPDYTQSLNNLAGLYDAIGNYAKAETIYLEALAICKRVPDEKHPDYTNLLNGLANLYSSIGNFTKAEALFIEAIATDKKVLGESHPDYARSLNNLALFYESTGNYIKAGPLFIEATSIAKKVLGEKHPNYANSLNNVANFHSSMKNYAKAEPLYIEALTIRKNSLGENHPDYANSLNNLATLYLKTGNYKKAEQFFDQALAILKKTLGENHPQYGSLLNNLAGLYEITNNYAKVEPCIRNANDNLNNQIRQNFSFMSEKEKELFVKTIAYNFEIYLSFALRYKKQKPEFVGLNYNNELAHKGMILQSNLLMQQAVKNSNNSGLIAAFDNLLTIKKMLARQYGLPIDKRTLKTDSLENMANFLEKSLNVQMQNQPGFENLKGLSSTTSWQDVQKSLKPGEAAIEFASFQYRSNKRWTDSIYYCALVLRKEDKFPKMIYLFEERQLKELIPTDAGSSGAIDNLYSLQGPLTKNLDGYLLYKLIWQPIDSVMKDINTVYFAPSGLLHKISFNAIATPDKKFLSDKFRLQAVSTTAVLAHKDLPFKVKPGIKTIIYGGIDYSIPLNDMIKQSNKYIHPTEEVVAAYRPILSNSAKRGGAWAYLSGTLKEAEGISDLFAKAKLDNTLLNSSAANEESFKALSGNGAPAIIHIATHGFFFPDPEKKNRDDESEGSTSFQVSDNPLQRSGLLFAGANAAWNNDTIPYNIEDGILTANEISQMYLPGTKLVVMSACETGLGDIKGSEGVFGLQRAFKMAGADYILMSLWQVPDEQTSELMQSFYKNWLEGKPVREAFSAAQNQLKDKYRDSPFLWAAFVLIR